MAQGSGWQAIDLRRLEAAYRVPVDAQASTAAP
ncbi:hypothetical protein GGR71_002067 [Xanthomonas sp. F1]